MSVMSKEKDDSSDPESDVPLAVRRDTLAEGRQRKPVGAMKDVDSEDDDEEEDDDDEEEDGDSEGEDAGKKRKRASGTYSTVFLTLLGRIRVHGALHLAQTHHVALNSHRV